MRDSPELREREADGWIGRERRRPDAELGRPGVVTGIAWGDDHGIVAEHPQHLDNPGDHRRHAVDLGRVCVGQQRDSHTGKNAGRPSTLGDGDVTAS
jgi:hypothetical protein